MTIVPIASITIAENRQRREFEAEAMQALADSIETRGLMHPVVVRDGPTGPVLVAGERRLCALADLHALGIAVRFNGATVPPDAVPVASLGELSPLEAEEAELDENIRRADLTWQERAAAERRLHELRAAQAAARGETHTVANTAAEIHGRSDGDYQARTRQSIIVAQHLNNPEVAKAKGLREAYKTVLQQEERQRNAERAATVGATFHAGLHRAFHVDCLEWMATTDPEQFDVICTDPPYGMGGDDFGDSGGKITASHRYDDSAESWITLMEAWAPLSFRVAKQQAHLYAFCDIDNFHALRTLLANAGWRVHRTPLILHKLTAVRVPWPQHGPRRCWEMVLYAVKGDRPVTAIYSDVFEARGDDNLGHGAQKPVASYTELLKRSVRPGDAVFDPFAGTGTLVEAAHAMKCVATVLEKSAESYGIVLKRLEAMA